MDFNLFKQNLSDWVYKLFSFGENLFTVSLDKDVLWELYLTSFPPEANRIFRKRQEHDCSACRSFIKHFGNVVMIKDSKVITIWDFESDDPVYGPVAKALSNFVKSHPVDNFFITKESQFGIDSNKELLENGQIFTFNHLFVRLPSRFVYSGRKTVDSVIGDLRSQKDVFFRSLSEITKDSVQTVLELIAENSLYKGAEWKTVLETFSTLQEKFFSLPEADRENWCWEMTRTAGPVVGKIRNLSIGTLLTDLSEGEDIETAVHSYEAMVAPTNYKRPKAVFTARMLEEAKKTIEELGYLDSLKRRFAVLDDISVNNILFADRNSSRRIQGSVFDEMKSSISVSPKKFDKIEEISIDQFVQDVLPKVESLEAFVENQHISNMVSLISPVNSLAPSMFKWGNSFSWAYTGNIADSMKERVKAMGGKVDGVMRFSIQWNEDGLTNDDLDAHCLEPSFQEIYFGQKRSRDTGGWLDVDIRNPVSEIENGIAVENITFPSLRQLLGGDYKFSVHNYCKRGGASGFSGEIEFDGQLYQFSHEQPLMQGETINVATVTYSPLAGFKLTPYMSDRKSSRNFWNLKSNQFHPVMVVMNSPNYWDGQNGVGNKHYFFMLKDCVNPETPNGFFNEFLKEDLMAHKRVLEALGGRMKVEFVNDQLSGIGFSSTKRNTLTVKVKGQMERILKIKF